MVLRYIRSLTIACKIMQDHTSDIMRYDWLIVLGPVDHGYVYVGLHIYVLIVDPVLHSSLCHDRGLDLGTHGSLCQTLNLMP